MKNMKKTFLKITIILLINLWGLWSYAQANPEDIVVATDDFQNSFFESLKQKGIENYDKAIESLEKCYKLQPNNAVVLFELGKNYLLQKENKKAYENFEKAAQIDPKNRWYLNGMYNVSYKMQDYKLSIINVIKLIEFDPNFKDDLITLYLKTNEQEKALALINELNDKIGRSEIRDAYKAQILMSNKFQDTELINLDNQIKKNPKQEDNYVSLIRLYINTNQEQKAEEIAKKLEIEIPGSEWAQVCLFKTHLNENSPEKAITSMNKVLGSSKIDGKIKHRILNEFLIFVKNNPKYSPELEKAIGYFKDDKEVKVAKEIGKFFQTKNDWENAIKYYELDAKTNENDLETTFLLLEAYTQKKQFDTVAKKSDAMIELFPLQPQLYYYSGLAQNQLKNFKKAKEILESGIDYLVENPSLEVNFNIQLGEAYSGLGDTKKKEFYFLKADAILKQKKQ